MSQKLMPCQKAFKESLHMVMSKEYGEHRYDCRIADVHVALKELLNDEQLDFLISKACLVHCKYLN